MRAGIAIGTCLLAASATTAAACGGDTPSTSATRDPASDPASFVRGRSVKHWWTAIGSYDEPVDLSSSVISAVVTRDTGIDVYPGVGKSDGSFAIPGVPQVPFSLRIDNAVYVHVAREVTLATSGIGRIDATLLPVNEYIGVHLRGLTTSGPIRMLTLNAGGVWRLGINELSGSNGIIDASVESCQPSCDLVAVNPARGDRSTLLQYEARDLENGVAYTTLASTLDLPYLAINQGAVIDGAVRPVDATAALTASWVGSEFAQVMAPWVTADVPGRGAIDLIARPPGAPLLELPPTRVRVFDREPPVSRLPSVARAEVQLSDAAIRTSFGNPFAQWETWSHVWVEVQPHSVAGRATIDQYDRTSSSALGALRPRVSPITDFRVNGAPVTEQAPAGETPTMSWTRGVSPPGTDLRYRVVLVNAFAFTMDPTLDPSVIPTVDLWTMETTVTVPPGLLERGISYLVMITAFPTTNLRFESAPLEWPLLDRASVVTGPVSP